MRLPYDPKSAVQLPNNSLVENAIDRLQILLSRIGNQNNRVMAHGQKGDKRGMIILRRPLVDGDALKPNTPLNEADLLCNEHQVQGIAMHLVEQTVQNGQFHS